MYISNIRAYLFDFDGTLVNSMPIFLAAMLQILDDHQIPYEQDIVKNITPLGFDGTADHFIKLGLNLPKKEIIASMKAHMLDEYLFSIPAKNNVVSVLHQLKARGNHLFVLTASPHATLDPCLKRIGIYDLFDGVWSCDDFLTTKADPNIYKMAAAKIGEDIQNILFLDDNLNADATAKAAGMLVCGVYDDSSKDYIEQIKAISDSYIYDFQELIT